MVVLVDQNDHEIGFEEKLKAHQQGLLHRAFSIFIINSKEEMLIQQRALKKYHSGGLWTNACCSHPRPGEKIEDAAHRRLQEEMGFDCQLTKAFDFVYKVHFEKDDIYEHEYDHVFFGKSDAIVKPDQNEVENFTWITLNKLTNEVKHHPERYTYWFTISLDKVIKTMYP